MKKFVYNMKPIVAGVHNKMRLDRDITGSIVIWTLQSAADYLNDIIAACSERYPELNIDPIYFSTAQELIYQVQSDSPNIDADLILLYDNDIRDLDMFFIEDLFEELDEYIDANNFDSSRLDDVSREGKIYGYPFTDNPVALYYRKDILGEISEPLTWEDYIAVGNEAKIRSDGMNVMPSTALGDLLMRASDEEGISELATVAILELYKSFMDDELLSDKPDKEYGDILSRIASGDIFSVIGAPYLIDRIREYVGYSEQAQEWGVTYMPKSDDLPKNVFYSGMSWYIVHKEGVDSRIEDILDMLGFISSDDMSFSLAENYNLIPASITGKAAVATVETGGCFGDGNIIGFLANIPGESFRYYDESADNYIGVVNEAIYKIITGLAYNWDISSQVATLYSAYTNQIDSGVVFEIPCDDFFPDSLPPAIHVVRLTWEVHCQTLYLDGQEFDFDGVSVHLEYSDGHTRSERIDDYVPKILTLGTTEVTVYWRDESRVIPVEVIKSASLRIIYPPNKTRYCVGDTFDIAGTVAEATYIKENDEEVSEQIGWGDLTAYKRLYFPNNSQSENVPISYRYRGLKFTGDTTVYKQPLESNEDCVTEQDFGVAGTGAITLSSGRLRFAHNDFSYNNANMPIVITRVYDKSAGNDYGLGIGWRLNLNQELCNKKGEWQYTNKIGRVYRFESGFGENNGRSDIRNEKLGLDLYVSADDKTVKLIDRSNNSLIFHERGDKYVLTAMHIFPSTEENHVASNMLVIQYNADGSISQVRGGMTPSGKIPTVIFGYENSLLKSLTLQYGDNYELRTVAEYTYGDTNLVGIKHCAGNMEYETAFGYNGGDFTVTDKTSYELDKNDKDKHNYRSIIYAYNGLKVISYSIGYGDDRDTADIAYTEVQQLSNKQDCGVLTSTYIKYKNTISVASFNEEAVTSQYSYQTSAVVIDFKKIRNVLSEDSHGFGYKSFSDKYSDRLDLFTDKDIENYSPFDNTFTLLGTLPQTDIYVSLWLLCEDANGCTLTITVAGNDDAKRIYSFDKKLNNIWQYAAFCLPQLKGGDNIKIEITGSMHISDFRITRAPYTFPFNYVPSKYNEFGNISVSQSYDPANNVTYETNYGYNGDHQITTVMECKNSIPFRTTEYGYDSSGMPNSVKTLIKNDYYSLESLTYDTNNAVLTSVNVNDVVSSYAYDANAAQTTIAVDNKLDFVYQDIYLSGTTILQTAKMGANRNYIAYNKDGTIESVSYGYTGEVPDLPADGVNYCGKICYCYDTYGNVNQVSYGNKTFAYYTYDSRHLTSLVYGNDYELAYEYDSEDRPTKIKTVDKNTKAETLLTNIYYTDHGDAQIEDIACGYKYTSNTVKAGGTLGTYEIYNTRMSKIVSDGKCSALKSIVVIQCAINNAGNESCTGYRAKNCDESSFILWDKTVTTNHNGQITCIIDRNLNDGKSETDTNATYKYNDLNQLTEKKVAFGKGKTMRVTYEYENGADGKQVYNRIRRENHYIGNTLVESFKYEYFENGNLWRITNKSNEKTWFGYDDNNRLTDFGSEPLNILSDEYHYDAAGNTDESGTIMDWLYYDGMGNLLKLRDMAFTWTGRNLMKIDKTIKIDKEEYHQIFHMEYDYAGRRTCKKDEYKNSGNYNNEIYYYWQDDKLLAEYNVTTNKTTRYIYDESGISGMAVYENGVLSKIYRFEKNIFGDVIAIYDNNAVLQCTYKYDAFGYPRVYDGNGSILKDDTNIGVSNPIRYRGYYYDTETGLYYLQSRYYDPRSKRFISPDDPSYLDPATVGGMNPYAYCMNNPVMYADPSGHGIFIIAMIIVTAVLTVGGAIGGGVVANRNGKQGWDFFASIFIGAALGFATAGLLIAGIGMGATIAKGVGIVAALGMSGPQLAAIGFLMYDLVAMIVAPFYGLDMGIIELDSHPYEPPKPGETPRHPYDKTHNKCLDVITNRIKEVMKWMI